VARGDGGILIQNGRHIPPRVAAQCCHHCITAIAADVSHDEDGLEKMIKYKYTKSKSQVQKYIFRFCVGYLKKYNNYKRIPLLSYV
jgi:hypothetical protein